MSGGNDPDTEEKGRSIPCPGLWLLYAGRSADLCGGYRGSEAVDQKADVCAAGAEISGSAAFAFDGADGGG